ncbi:MAG: HAMP domain-containing histidine kinase [Chlorobi bacterium]|nr:HAMP domain-containing histidine kinase [Chlorobiota bacterium]
MKKRTLRIIIILSTIALAGIVFSQVYWVKQAVDLKTEQFDNSVRLATKGIVNQFYDQKNDSAYRHYLYLLSCRKVHLEVTDYVQVDVLDSLLEAEFACMNINSPYFYGIYNDLSGKFVGGNYDSHRKEIRNSIFQFSLYSIYKPADYYLGVYFPNSMGIIAKKMMSMIVVSALFLIVLISLHIFVVYAILRQKKVSEIKNDFINNLTHEFKTPIATTSLAAEMLVKENINTLPKKVEKYANVILYENMRLQSQVEQILQIASFEKGNFDFKFEKVDMHQLINNIIVSFELRIEKSKALINIRLNAFDFTVNTDLAHITNVIYNLMDNAIKYSLKIPEITIETKNVKKGILISVKDKGVGISRQYHKDVFKNLFRIPTGNIQEVRGFGLGLYYSKYVVESLGGSISLDSERGKGSVFMVFLPIKRLKKL